MKRFVAHGGHWVLIQTSILTAIAIGAPLRGRLAEHGFALGLAAVLLVVGTALFAGGTFALHRNLSVFTRPREGAVLRTGGVYGIVRHPIYTGILAIALGWSILWSCPPAGLATLPLALVLLRKSVLEERILLETFPDYARYAASVRHRLIPGVL